MTVYLQRNFLLTFLAHFFSSFGSKLLMISYVAFIFQETADASAAALVFAIDWLTNLFVGLIVSQWIDRQRAKQLIIWLNVAAACVTLAFLGFTSPSWYAAAIGIIFVRGILNSSVNAARVKALIQFFAKEQTELYAPVFSSSQPVAWALAGAVGIAILNYTSFAVVIVADAATFLLAALLISFTRPDEDRVRDSIVDSGPVVTKLAGIKNAFAVIARNRKIASGVFYIIISVTSFQATYEVLITVIPQLWFERGPSGTAMFFLVESVASAFGLFAYQYFSRRGRITGANHRAVSIGIVGVGLLCYAAMPLANDNLVVCCALFVPTVMSGSALWAHAFTQMVTETPEARIASVVGAQTAMGYSLMGVFALTFSAALNHWGAGWTIVVNALVAVVLVVVWEFLNGSRRAVTTPESAALETPAQ